MPRPTPKWERQPFITCQETLLFSHDVNLGLALIHLAHHPGLTDRPDRTLGIHVPVKSLGDKAERICDRFPLSLKGAFSRSTKDQRRT
jgi:hypothetical protein